MIVSRFAPAPTGLLHLGHVVNAIYVWGLTKAAGGQVLLRIEDHDRQRSRPEFERAILDDLDWLGFHPDAPSTDAFRAGPCQGRQRDRHAVYVSALDALRTQGLIYACECSRKDVASSSADLAQSELRYAGTCADKGLAETPGRGLRLRLDPSLKHVRSVPDRYRLDKRACVEVAMSHRADPCSFDPRVYWISETKS